MRILIVNQEGWAMPPPASPSGETPSSCWSCPTTTRPGRRQPSQQRRLDGRGEDPLLPRRSMRHRVSRSPRWPASLWVTGKGKDGEPREVYLYHVVDNEWAMREYGAQCVVWLTAINPAVALELLAMGVWLGTGVRGPESIDAVPFLGLLKPPSPAAMARRAGCRTADVPQLKHRN